jgi:hypothetical protein
VGDASHHPTVHLGGGQGTTNDRLGIGGHGGDSRFRFRFRLPLAPFPFPPLCDGGLGLRLTGGLAIC